MKENQQNTVQSWWRAHRKSQHKQTVKDKRLCQREVNRERIKVDNPVQPHPCYHSERELLYHGGSASGCEVQLSFCSTNIGFWWFRGHQKNAVL